MQVQLTWEETIERLEAFFQEADLQVVRSFDLQTAREGLRDPAACPCPHHGTARCSCQYLVFLLYTSEPEPLAVVVHGYDSQTQVAMEAGQDGTGRELQERLSEVLRHPHSPLGTIRN